MKMLIVFATKTGVTKDVAHALKKKLQGDVTVEEMGYVNDRMIELYDFIVLGAPVYMGQALAKMRRFVKLHKDVLLEKRLAFFFVGGDKDADMDALLLKGYGQTFFEKSERIVHMGGEFRFEKMGFLSRFIVKTVAKSKRRKTGQAGLPVLDAESMEELAMFLNEVLLEAGAPDAIVEV